MYCSPISPPKFNPEHCHAMSLQSFIAIMLFASAAVDAPPYPEPTERDFTVKDFNFTSGETLHKLRLRYWRTGGSQNSR
jgi:hypothetical protein